MSIQAGNAGAASQRTGSPVRRRARGLAFDRTGSCDAGECRRHSRSIRFPFGGRRTANQVAIRCGSSRRSIVWAAVAGVALSRTFPGHGHRRSRVAAARRVRWIQIETTLTTRKKNNPTCGGVTWVAGKLGPFPRRANPLIRRVARQVDAMWEHCGTTKPAKQAHIARTLKPNRGWRVRPVQSR